MKTDQLYVPIKLPGPSRNGPQYVYVGSKPVNLTFYLLQFAH